MLALLLDAPWSADALCAQTDPELFFPEKGGATHNAKKVCRACPVRDECLQLALDNGERFGIWGGLSERERRGLDRHTNSKELRLLDPPEAPATTPAPPAPAPITIRPAPPKDPAMTTTQEQQQPAYVDQIITLMAATEGHPDPAVRAARKTVANALVALNKAAGGVATTAAAPVKAAPRPRSSTGGTGKHGNHYNPAERIAALRTTARDIRAWATQVGIDCPSRGALPARILDAYEQHLIGKAS